MMQMVRECDRSQRRLAGFLLVVMALEITFICFIIEHEHKDARVSWAKLVDATLERLEANISVEEAFMEMKLNKSFPSRIIQAVRSGMSKDHCGYKGTRAHFSLGNEKPDLLSSYQIDYRFQMNPVKHPGKTKSPPAARVLPESNSATERNKFVSSTMLDFTNYGNQCRRAAYEHSRELFQQTKTIHTQNTGLLKYNVSPPITRYASDFRYYRQSPQKSCVNVVQRALAEYNRKREATSSARACKTGSSTMISEAKAAFQWPHSQRLKLPSYLHVGRH